MLNILFINQFSEMGGGEKALLSIIKNLDKTRYRPSVVLPRAGKLSKALKDMKVSCHFVAIGEYSDGRKKLVDVLKYLIFSFNVVPKLIERIKKDHIDIIYANSPRVLPWACLAARAGRARVIWHVRCISGRLEKKVASAFAKDIKMIIVDSQAAKNSLSAGGIPVRVIPAGIDLSLFPAGLPFGAGEQPPVIGAAGRLVKLKGFEDLIMAAPIVLQKFPNVRFTILGDALFGKEDYKEHLSRLIEDMGLKDKFLLPGFVDDMAAAYREMGLFVNCSRCEGFGYVVVEAMASGLPIVASDIPSVREIAGQDGRIEFYQPGDTEGLAAAVIKLLKEPSLAMAMAEKNKAVVKERFDEKKQIRKIEQIIDQVCR
ncbi:MAG: glycosyltransferase family 4 protein [Candidatus Margulisbacteria bacterium]|nr:glycosyltransferase family 4 protein [Candidatus Margulisiibacteriota bacterium]